MMNNISDTEIQNIVDRIVTCRKLLSKIKLNEPDKIIENIDLTDSNAINVFLASDLICSSCGLGIARYSFDDKTDKSFEILKLMGLNLEASSEKIVHEFDKLKFAYFSLDSKSYYDKKNCESLSKLLNDDILDKILNPFDAKNCTIGVKSKDEVEKFAKICLKLNNTNSLIMSGANGLPYVSIEGESFIAEAWKNKIFTYIINPNLLGFNLDENSKDVICENNSHNAQILSDIFSGKLKDSNAYNTIVLNSALVLYISKVSPSIVDGIALAKKTIDSGLVNEKIMQLKNFFS